MPGEPGSRGDRRKAAYATLLAAQTMAASIIFWMSFPIFQQVVARSGQPQSVPASTIIPVVAAAMVLQVCYWRRYRRVAIWAPVRSAFVGHLLLFAARASFFFGSALFSAIFFRHLPQLDALPPLGQGLAKVVVFMTVLFSLFCYALEVERLGREVEQGPAHPGT